VRDDLDVLQIIDQMYLDIYMFIDSLFYH